MKKNSLDMVRIKMVKDKHLLSEEVIDTPQKAINVLGESLCDMDREVFMIVNLNENNTPINANLVTIGTINAALVTPREVFKTSILSNAAKIMLFHNHPSGNVSPSKRDIEVTAQLKKAGDILGIPVIDHIIIGRNNKQYFSFNEGGVLDNILSKRAAIDDSWKKQEMLSLAERGIKR